MTKSQSLWLAALLAWSCNMAYASVMINEVMQSNVYTIMDDLNDFPDSWVELYNNSDNDVDLNGYRIGIKDNFDKAYTIPEATIPAYGYVLIYCDKVGKGLHTDFRIDSGKGSLYLYDAQGYKIDQITMVKQPAPDTAWGRDSDASEVWGYQLTPTPGSSNKGGITDKILGNVEFSVPGGVWKDSQNISLELKTPKKSPDGTYIIYTTDGNEPTVENSTVYSEPIEISTSMVVRAKAVCQGAISAPSTTESYIFTGRDVNVPVISISVNPDYLYNDQIGIFAVGPGGWMAENFRKDWRRPINIEYFEGHDGARSQFNQLGETCIQGNTSRSNNLKSMKVYTNKRFGQKRFAYNMWAKDKPEISDTKSFILRNGGNDFDYAYLRDALCQRVIGRNTDIDWQGCSPAVVYINGQYHGMLNVRERSSEDNIASNYNGLEDIDMWESNEELKAGDPSSLKEFEDFVYGPTHTYEEWSQYIDVDCYINLMAINHWVYNYDFPQNNIVMWRRTDGGDPRWRWLVKDMDYGLGMGNSLDYVDQDYHQFMYSYPMSNLGFDTYQRLMLTQFRDEWIDHLVVYQGDFLNARTFNSYLDEIYDERGDEQHISHFKWGSGHRDYDDNIEFIRNWIDQRQQYMPTLMRKAYDLGLETHVSVNTASQGTMIDNAITYDGIPLTQNVFDGYDYAGRTIRLDGEGVYGWKLQVGDGPVAEFKGSSLTYTIGDSGDPIVIEPMTDTSISEIDAAKPSSIRFGEGYVYADCDIEIYDLSGRLIALGSNVLRLPSRGAYIVRAVDGTQAKIIW